MKSIYEKLNEFQKRGIECALCIVVSTHGSAPGRAGAKMLVLESGEISGTVGGGALEKKVIENALLVIKEKKAGLFRHDLLHQHNMCCGGTVDIYIEPVMKKNKLYIFGAGHTGMALSKYAPDFGFETVLIDDRKEYMDNCLNPSVNKMHFPFLQALQLLPFDDRTYIAILTYNHETDRDILAFCLKKPHAYLGMIGSRRKVAVTKKMFAEAGIGTQEQLESVDMPMGIGIHADMPEEIAISILARLIMIKNSSAKRNELEKSY